VDALVKAITIVERREIVLAAEAATRTIRSMTVLQHHPHSSLRAREIAERGTILRTQVGSGVHGTAVGGQDDRDEMGLCLEPPEFVTGVARVPASGGEEPGWVPFHQYEYHSAWEREGGLRNRSGAGDLDVVIYSARKWVRLALGGNPTVLLPLFAPESERS